MMRVFLAIPLPETVRDQLSIVAQMLPVPRRVPPENLHLTLTFLGDASARDLEALHSALEGVQVPSFPIALRGLDVFGRDKPKSVHATIAPQPALTRLAGKVETAARRAGIEVAARKFVPHVTLARFRPAEVDVPRLERAIIDLAGVSAGPFDVTGFTLYQSHLGDGPPVYEVLAEYELRS